MNQVKIALYSKHENKLIDKQINLIETLWHEAATIKARCDKDFNLKNNKTFLNPLINQEAIYSGNIENSQTNIDDTDYDLEEINNRDAWESRNIINLYKKVFYQIDNDLFSFQNKP